MLWGCARRDTSLQKRSWRTRSTFSSASSGLNFSPFSLRLSGGGALETRYLHNSDLTTDTRDWKLSRKRVASTANGKRSSNVWSASRCGPKFDMGSISWGDVGHRPLLLIFFCLRWNLWLFETLECWNSKNSCSKYFFDWPNKLARFNKNYFT